MAVQADELRKRQMACILLWMGGGPSQFETFDPKPGTANGGDTKAIDTAVPGIKIANGWNKTAKVMKDDRPHPLDDQQGRQPPAGHLPAPHRLRPHGHGQAPELRLRASPTSWATRSSTCRTSSASAAATRRRRAARRRRSSRSSSRTREAAGQRRPRRSPAGRFSRRLDLLHALEHSGFDDDRRRRPRQGPHSALQARRPAWSSRPG